MEDLDDNDVHFLPRGRDHVSVLWGGPDPDSRAPRSRTILYNDDYDSSVMSSTEYQRHKTRHEGSCPHPPPTEVRKGGHTLFLIWRYPNLWWILMMFPVRHGLWRIPVIQKEEHFVKHGFWQTQLRHSCWVGTCIMRCCNFFVTSSNFNYLTWHHPSVSVLSFGEVHFTG